MSCYSYRSLFIVCKCAGLTTFLIKHNISLLHFLIYQITLLVSADTILAVKISEIKVIFREVGHSLYISGVISQSNFE